MRRHPRARIRVLCPDCLKSAMASLHERKLEVSCWSCNGRFSSIDGRWKKRAAHKKTTAAPERKGRPSRSQSRED